MATSSASLDRSPKSNWVQATGPGLPPYIRTVARAIEKERGIPLSTAIGFAIGRVKKWAAGGDGVSAETKATAAKAVAEWETLKARNRGRVKESALDMRFDPEAGTVEAWEVCEDDLPDLDDARLLEAVALVVEPLAMEFEPGDLRVLEAAKPAAMSNAKRKAGESLGAWGSRLKSGDRRAQATQDAKTKAKRTTRSGASSDFEKDHPRARGGSWTLKTGAKGDDVKAVQRRVGAKADGEYGQTTRQKVMDFQRRKGLKVDGVVGKQTVAAMRGDQDAANVKPGKASAEDRRWVAGKARGKNGDRGKDRRVQEGALAVELDADGRVSQTPADGDAICESANLVLVRTDEGHSTIAVLEAAMAGDDLFNVDGTIDMVILRPCNGRGLGSSIFEAPMLKDTATVWAGVSMYDNHEHPDAVRARKGIPRSPSELAGQIRESWWDPTFTTPDDAKMGYDPGGVIGRCMLVEDMEKLVRRIPGAVKTSVNAQATGKRAAVRRGKRGLIVEGFVNDPENMSVDLVTKAGAGGAVAALYRQLAA